MSPKSRKTIAPEPTLARFGVSLEPGLLTEFDRLIESKGYDNRSEAIRDLIRDRLVTEALEHGTDRAVGTLTLVYSHDVRELDDRLNELQHEHYESIVSAVHVHLDPHHCMEVLILRGKAATLKSIADRLIGTKGVAHGTFSATVEGSVLPGRAGRGGAHGHGHPHDHRDASPPRRKSAK